jgi:hypothetical protein
VWRGLCWMGSRFRWGLVRLSLVRVVLW